MGFSPTGFLDREKGAGSKKFQNLVDVFRGVSFDGWLQLSMEVIGPLFEPYQPGVDQLRVSVFSFVNSS